MRTKLCIEDKQIIIKRIRRTFKIDDIEAEQFYNEMEESLFNKNKNFFYSVKYNMHFQKDTYFSEKVLQFAITTFSFLLKKEIYHSEEKKIKNFFQEYLKIILVEPSTYAKEIERRRDNVQNILQHVSEQLNQSLDVQQLMIANISHEMRTSLNTISGYIALIDEKNTLDTENKGYLEKANHAAHTLESLVSDILDVSKINSGQMEIKEESFWLDEMIEKAIDNITFILNKKNLTFKTDIEFFSQKIIGDYQHIMEIIINLLSNAIKYTDIGFVHLKVTNLEETDNTIKILFEIKDSGIGMTPKQLKKIFNPFSRFEKERQGVGLGLHIASKLASKMGGEITVESTADKGSTFRFTIKVKQDKQNNIDMSNFILCFLNNTKETKVSQQKLDFLKQFNAKVTCFKDEKTFINYLTSSKNDTPHIISILSYQNAYDRFNALIHYLKTLDKFKKSYFIAEGINPKSTLNYFDKVYERFTPITTYIQILDTIKKSNKNTISSNIKALNILAVDDIETNLEILKLFITNKYPHVTLDLATGGYEAIGMYKTQNYDMILMDLKMPGLSGFQTLEKLKNIKNPPASYALTADVYKSTYDQVIEAGFIDLLEKPLQLDILFATIEKAIDEKYNS